MRIEYVGNIDPRKRSDKRYFKGDIYANLNPGNRAVAYVATLVTKSPVIEEHRLVVLDMAHNCWEVINPIYTAIGGVAWRYITPSVFATPSVWGGKVFCKNGRYYNKRVDRFDSFEEADAWIIDNFLKFAPTLNWTYYKHLNEAGSLQNTNEISRLADKYPVEYFTTATFGCGTSFSFRFEGAHYYGCRSKSSGELSLWKFSPTGYGERVINSIVMNIRDTFPILEALHNLEDVNGS